MVKFFKSGFTVVTGIVVICLLFFLGSDIVEPPPTNAVVVLKYDSKTYLAPPCINNNFNLNNENFAKSTLKEAKALGYKPDNCSEHALYPSRSTIIHYTLEPLGLVKPLNRWDKNGDWLY